MTSHPTVAPRSARGRINSAVLTARLVRQRQSDHDGRRRRLVATPPEDLAAQLRRRLADLRRRLDEARWPVAACRICGCTEDFACPGGCWWVPDPAAVGDLCSSCLPEVRDAG